MQTRICADSGRHASPRRVVQNVTQLLLLRRPTEFVTNKPHVIAHKTFDRGNREASKAGLILQRSITDVYPKPT